MENWGKEITKPILHTWKANIGEEIEYTYRCSCCGRDICYSTDFNIKDTYPYCHCGRKIDWSRLERND